jgi:hypothetical protein
MMIKTILSLFLALLLWGCDSSGGRTSGSTAGSISNSTYSVNYGYGRILKANPIILSGDPDLPAGYDLGKLLSSEQDFITESPLLKNSCQDPYQNYTKNQCYKVLKHQTAPPLTPISGRWAFPPNSEEFLEVHGYAHMTKKLERYQKNLFSAYLNSNPLLTLGGGSYPTSISPYLYTQGAFWGNDELTLYTTCQEEGAAYFAPSKGTICLATDPQIENFSFAQDPSVIYHEIGHALHLHMINSRNQAAQMEERTDLGKIFYDEGMAISEGFCDYQSYVMNQRTHFAEWGLGRFYLLSRPMSEEDELHSAAISRDDDSRLRYPDFLNYEANEPEVPYEDSHNAGQITSHFLVALTEELISDCHWSFDQATMAIHYAIFETLSELGDMTSKQSDNQTASPLEDRVNLSELRDRYGALVSKLWIEVVNPPNYRRFFQVFSRYMLYHFDGNNPSLSCPAYNQDKLEKLLDKYGLLLFKTYNEDGQGILSGRTETNTEVTLANRRQSVLIPKNQLIIDPRDGAPTVYIFDQQDNIIEIVSDAKMSGAVTRLTSLIPSTLPYNNGNGEISPGEVVGISLNLYNNSHSIMGGVQLLANDWDHGKLEDWDPTDSESGTLKPCNTFSDGFPLNTEGAATTSSNPQMGDCEYITRTNGTDEEDTNLKRKEVLMPICMVQLIDGNQTQWVSQKEFRDHIGLPSHKCLLGSESPNDCFIRVLPGAEQAYFSKLNPKSNWGETFASNQGMMFNAHNLILMEVNPWLPPGTTLDCRFRARFTNCDDCWHDATSSQGDDYLDYEFSGGRPYQILHYQFIVID